MQTEAEMAENEPTQASFEGMAVTRYRLALASAGDLPCSQVLKHGDRIRFEAEAVVTEVAFKEPKGGGPLARKHSATVLEVEVLGVRKREVP